MTADATMDILEDIANAIRYILNHLGFDVNNLDQILQPLPERERNIRDRSIIRRVGSRLPLKPARRIQVQNLLLSAQTNDGVHNDSFGSVFSYVSSGGDNLVWVEEDLGNNCIMVRPRDKHRNDSPEPELQDIEEDRFLDPLQALHEERTSTPFDQSIGSASALSAVDPFTHQKISAMEEELAALRSQIALLIKDQENKKLPPIPYPTMCSEGVTPPPPPPPACPPPPPPPPPPVPPPTPTGFFKAPKPGKTLAEMLKENKDQLTTGGPTGSGGSGSGPVSMTEVLKGLGTVKLRAVQRSPGGTPLRPDKPRLSESQDPASLIANALKKKFASRMLHSPRSPCSPDTDQENDYASPDSPIAPFGQGLLKKTKKRSALFERRQSASPLQERNQ